MSTASSYARWRLPHGISRIQAFRLTCGLDLRYPQLRLVSGDAADRGVGRGIERAAPQSKFLSFTERPGLPGSSVPVTFAPECRIPIDGFLTFNLLAAAPIAVLLTLLTLFAYRWRVGRGMHERGGAPPPEPAPGATAPGAELRTVLLTPEVAPAARATGERRQAQQRLRAVALVYMVAGMAHAAVFTSLQFALGDVEVRPLRWIAFFIVYAWPLIPVLMVSAVAGVRHKLFLALVYFLALGLADLALEATGMRYRSAPGELFVLWAVTMGPPTAVLLLLSNRAWRAVGLLAFLLAFLGVTGFSLVFHALGCFALSTGAIGIMSLRWPLTAAVVPALVWSGWRVLRRIADRYGAKRLSDQSLTLDSWWLTITLLGVVSQSNPYGAGSLAFLLAFVAYTVVARIGLRRVQPVRSARTLLLLRVFGKGRRSTRLLDDVGQRWRYAGPIVMIGGTDLATACLEPDELLRFWRGRLREAFVTDRAALDARLARLDTAPDPDTRYRVSELFCHDDTWQPAVRELAHRSDAVLMDLRGFSPETHRGCRFELGVLLADVPLERVVLLVDPSTAIEPLAATLRQQWRTQPEGGINRASVAPEVRLFRASRGERDLPTLLAAVISAADTKR